MHAFHRPINIFSYSIRARLYCMFSCLSWILEVSFFCFFLYLTLSDEVLLKLLQELQIEQIVRGQGFFSHHGLHRLHVLTDSIACILRGGKDVYRKHRRLRNWGGKKKKQITASLPVGSRRRSDLYGSCPPRWQTSSDVTRMAGRWLEDTPLQKPNVRILLGPKWGNGSVSV